MYRIRAAVASDFDQGLKSCLQAFTDDVIWLEPAANEVLIVAVSDMLGSVIGTAKGIMEEKMIHGRCCMHIEDVAVDPDYRGMGIGKALVDSLVEYARVMQAYKVVLNCDEDVFEWYRKMGFDQYGYSMRLSLE